MSELDADVAGWVNATAGVQLTHARAHIAGASRRAWSIDAVARDGSAVGLFLMRDNLGGSGGSARDAAVLRALEPTGLPVPHVYGNDPERGTLLLSRVDGRSDFPAVDDEAEREPTARHLMQLTAALHELEPASLAIDHLGPPADPAHHATAQLANARRALELLGAGAAPLFGFAVTWLARNVPAPPARTSLVHSDMGPGNFLYQRGRVTALVDWEVAHWGDAMEDLAAISIRDMATPIGHLPTRFAEYAAAGGAAVDLARIRWYRVLVLARNSMMITLGLQRDDAALDRAQLTMFRVLLMRAAALALCDAIGVARPDEPPFDKGPASADSRLMAHAARDLRDRIAGELADPVAHQRAQGAAASLAYAENLLRHTHEEHERDLDEFGALLGRRPPDIYDGWARFAATFDDERRDADTAQFFARHLLRRGMLAAPLLGPLADRLPQPLEAP